MPIIDAITTISILSFTYYSIDEFFFPAETEVAVLDRTLLGFMRLFFACVYMQSCVSTTGWKLTICFRCYSLTNRSGVARVARSCGPRFKSIGVHAAAISLCAVMGILLKCTRCCVHPVVKLFLPFHLSWLHVQPDASSKRLRLKCLCFGPCVSCLLLVLHD